MLEVTCQDLNYKSCTAMNQPPMFQILMGANESFIDTNYFRDILIVLFEPIKEEDQVDINLEESCKNMYFDSLAPNNLCFCTGQS